MYVIFKQIFSTEKVILTVHDGLDLINWTQDKDPLTLGGLNEAKSSTAQARRSHDLLQGVAFLTLAFRKFASRRQRNAHLSWSLRLAFYMATHQILFTVMLLDREHGQGFAGPQLQTAEGHLGVAGEGKRKGIIQAHRPQTQHLLDWCVRHLLRDHFEQS